MCVLYLLGVYDVCLFVVCFCVVVRSVVCIGIFVGMCVHLGCICLCICVGVLCMCVCLCVLYRCVCVYMVCLGASVCVVCVRICGVCRFGKDLCR